MHEDQIAMAAMSAPVKPARPMAHANKEKKIATQSQTITPMHHALKVSIPGQHMAKNRNF